MITLRDFVDRWAHSHLREQQAAQSHFNELCQLVGHKTPTQADPEGTFFTFEEQVAKVTGGKGRADVWFKGHFAWEYKGKHKGLDAAYSQLLAYKGDLDNPPLLVVCDFLEYRIYPQWPNTSGLPFVFRNEDLLHQQYRDFIRWLLTDPDAFLRLRRAELEEREKITLQLAEKFAHLADLMRQHRDAQDQPLWQSMQIARFLTKLVFALFAEDIGLLPVIAGTHPALRYIFEGAERAPEGFVRTLKLLFQAMNGDQIFAMEYVPYFNGGLFAESRPGAEDGFDVLDMTEIPGATILLNEVSEADWRFVNPTIFGTLFEGALDISKRAQLGAHYTGEADIRLVVEPVLMQPLYRQWDAMQPIVQSMMQTFLDPNTSIRPQTEAKEQLIALHDQMMNALENMRVLDPACGSGNFLYMSLRALKDLEGRVRRAFEPLELPYRDVVTPRQLYGIEKDEFAANLAKVVVWIGYLQWRYEDEGGVLHYYVPRKIEHPRQLPTPILKDKNSPDEPDRETQAANDAGSKKTSKAGGPSRLGQLMDKRRKPILLGLAAIVFAIGAAHVVTGALTGDQAETSAKAVIGSGPKDLSANKDLSASKDISAAKEAVAPKAATPAAPAEAFPAKDQSSAAPALPARDKPETTALAPAGALDGKTAAALAPALQAPAQPAVPAPPAAAPQTATAVEPVTGIKDIPPTLGTPGQRRAALEGDARAVYELAVKAADATGTARDPKVALRLFERAAAAGLAPAQFRLGNMFEKGIGTGRDIALARLWYERAADKGNAKAMHNLAVLYAEGASGKPDYATAVQWFRQAAEHGVRDSQYNLAILLARGLGTAQDLTQSYTWFAVAAGQGDEDAGKKREEVAGQLQPPELNAAKTAVSRWQPKTPMPGANEVVSPQGGWDESPAAPAKKPAKISRG